MVAVPLLVVPSKVDKYLGRIQRWLWVRDFVAWKRRGTSSRRIAAESSLARYVEVLERLERYTDLDLRTCSLEELNGFLDELRARYKPNGYINTIAIIKDALNFLKRDELNGEIRIPARPDPTESVREAVIPDDEIEKLIRGCSNLRDRLLVEVFSELGNRRGEMWNLRIKDVQFDEYSAILTLRGKSGTRRRRLYESVPDLRAWLNDHPLKSNPDAPLLLTMNGEPFTDAQGIYQVIKRISKRILGHQINPHRFRHTRATKDSSYFTDREMLKLYGWKKGETIKVYSHLSMKEVDDKDLVLHGLKTKEEILRPIMQTQRCPKCGESNAPIAMYCSKCGSVLAKPNEEIIEKLQQQIQALQGQFETAFKAKVTDAG